MDYNIRLLELRSDLNLTQEGIAKVLKLVEVLIKIMNFKQVSYLSSI